MNYFYGPVLSRRLGLSLGIDLLKFKSCNFDCLYCQLGRTKCKITRRFDRADAADFKFHLIAALTKYPNIDCFTFSGSGEPTLHKHLDRFIAAVRQINPKIKICLITNSSLLIDSAVREEILGVDIIVPSLDAVTPAVFKKINNPPAAITAVKIIRGLVQLRKQFKGEIWLEIMLVKGINDDVSEAIALKKAVEKINPDKVHINLPIRPSQGGIAIADAGRAALFQKIIGLKAEIIGSTKRRGRIQDKEVTFTDIMGLLRCHSATTQDICYALGVKTDRCEKIIVDLIKKKKIKSQIVCGKKYWVIL